MFITRLIHYTKKKTFFNFIFIAIFYQLRFEAYQSVDIANVIEQFTLKFIAVKNNVFFRTTIQIIYFMII